MMTFRGSGEGRVRRIPWRVARLNSYISLGSMMEGRSVFVFAVWSIQQSFVLFLLAVNELFADSFKHFLI